MSSEKLLKLISDEDAEYVDIRFTDPRGKLQHVTVMSDQVDSDFIDEGFMFDGSSIAGWKSIEASDTLEELIRFEKNNPNLYLAKSVVDIYNFNPRKAEINIQKAINTNNNSNLNSTINTIKIISNIINLRISSLTKI